MRVEWRRALHPEEHGPLEMTTGLGMFVLGASPESTFLRIVIPLKRDK